MKIEYESLQVLMYNLEHKLDGLLTQLASQKQEIKELNNRNQKLENYCHQTLKQIEKYVVELEQIKNYYADSHHNSEQ